MIFSPFAWRHNDRQAASRQVSSRKKRRSAESSKTAAKAPEQLEQRKMLAFDFVAAFADSTTPFYVSGVNDGMAELNESPQQLTLRFSPGTVIDASTLSNITFTRTGQVGDPFGTGGAYPDVTITPGSITVGDAPNENEVVVRFAETLVDDVYRITIGDELRAVTGEQATAASFDVRLDLGAFVTSVVPQPIIRGKAIEFTAVPENGDLLEISVRGAGLLFTFDSDPAAVDGNVDPETTAVTVATDGRTASEVAAAVRSLMTPGGSPSAAFGGAMASIGGTGATISLEGEVFTPVVAFHRMISSQTIEFSEVPADGSLLEVSILGNGLQLTFNSDEDAINGSLDPDTGATVIATDGLSTRQVAVAVQRVLAPFGVPSAAFGDAMAEIRLVGTTITVSGKEFSPSASFSGDLVPDADDLLVPAATVASGEAYSVVPEGLVGVSDGGLTQFRDTVVVYFNAEDPLETGSAESPANYQLFQSDPVSGAEQPPVVPASVDYDSTSGTAVLTFAAGDLTDGMLFRLQIGNAASDLGSAIAHTEADDANSSFGSATPLGELAPAGGSVDGAIDVRPAVPTPIGPLPFPSQPGAISELGHRDIAVNLPLSPALAVEEGERHGTPVAANGPAEQIAVAFYNFKSAYGRDPQGNLLINAITETQKLRTREIFDLLSQASGIRFVESADEGLTIVTGDLRAIDGTLNTNPDGYTGPSEAFPDMLLAVMDSTNDWGDSEYGGDWFRVAMHHIGHALGLDHSYDIPSIMGAGLSGEPVFAGDYDIEHLNQLYPKTGSDIDIYSFTLSSSGHFSAETVVARPGTPVISLLDSVITLYRENADGVREMIARNDDYFGRDSYLSLDLEASDGQGTPYTYYIAVTSTGNTAFHPEVEDSGYGGRSDGDYELRLHLDPVREPASTVVDASGTKLDGNRNGEAGGAFQFWFETASEASTIFVDKLASAGGDGSLASPYVNLDTALADARQRNASSPGSAPLVRIVGNRGNAATANDDVPYLIGKAPQGNLLPDGGTFTVPKDVTVMVDADALFKLRDAVIDVGSSSPLPSVSRAGAALQVLGTPGHSVRFTSYHDDSQGGDSDGAGPAVAGGNWGGIVLREDSDVPSQQAFLNSIVHADIQYGGGQVLIDSSLQAYAPIHLETSRPSLAFNRVTNSSGAGISADPNSFEESGNRVGPELRGNVLDGNSINGLFIRIETTAGGSVSKLTVPARLTSPEIVYVIAENLVIAGGAGGYVLEANGDVTARESGRLRVDPGVVVKLSGSRIELERGNSQLIAEGTAGNRVVFTSLADNRYGAAGTFDTNGIITNNFTPGDWGGIFLNAGAKASIDSAYVGFGGGTTPIEGGFDQFNVFEVHQGDFRLASSRVESNAGGLANTNRSGRGGNADATIFVRGAQPIIVGNDFRDNAAALISINANSLNDTLLPDPGRTTGELARYSDYDDNFGPLVRGNRISYYVSTPVLTPPTPPSTIPTFPGRPNSLDTYQLQWRGVTTEAIVDSWVMRTAPGASFVLTAGWDARSLGEGFHELYTPDATRTDVMAWAAAQDGIATIEPNFVYQTTATYPNDPDFDQLWGLENTGQLGGTPDADIDAPEAWDVTTGSRSVVIAVVDSGIDYNHPDLAANMWQNPGEIPGDGVDNDGNGFIDDVYGWDFGEGDSDPIDTDGHGTHVAGTIGAASDNGVGVTGVAWDVQMMALKVGDSTGGIPLTAQIEAMNYITQMRRDFGINIVASNNSYGSRDWSVAFPSQNFLDAIDNAGRAGVLFVTSAGNGGFDGIGDNNDLLPTYPNSYDSEYIISVAATDRFNNLAGFSNYGTSTVDIGAPGVEILSTLPNDSYGVQSGTSMASPQVAGVAALVAAANPGASALEIRQAILSSAEPIASLTGQVATGGLLNALGAVEAIQGSAGISGMVVRGEEITVESVWDDVDIVHVLRNEIVVQNFHTKTGVRLLSQPNASLVIKADGASAGFTAAGFALDIDDRVGGTVQVVGQPGYPVVMTSYADDSIGVSLDALSRVVRDTNGDGSGSQPAAGDWRGLRFLPMSNDRNVSIVREGEVAYTAQLQANGSVATAEPLGVLAPNFAVENAIGVMNSWDSAQEAGGDDNRRLGFEVHGSISYDDPSDVDVYNFSGYAGSEVWIDIDNTSSSLDAMVELLDADGNVLARSADSLLDTGVARGEMVSEDIGGQALVEGIEQVATGVAAVVDGVWSNVAGEDEAVVGTAAQVTRAATTVVGSEEAVTGTAASVVGIAARVAETSPDQGILGIAVASTKPHAPAETVLAVDDVSAIQVGATLSIEGTATAAVVVSVDATTNEVTLAAPLGTFVGDGELVTFDLPDATEVTTSRLVINDLSTLTGTERVNVDGIPLNARIADLDFDNSVILLDTPLAITSSSVVDFEVATLLVSIDTPRFDQVAEFDGLAVSLNGVPQLDSNGDPITVDGVINGNAVTLTSDLLVADGDVLSFALPATSVTGDTFEVDDATVASVGVAVTLNGADTGLTVSDIPTSTSVVLSGDLTVVPGDFLGFAFAGEPVATTRITVADTTGIAAGAVVNGLPGLPSDLLVSEVVTHAGSTSGTVTFDQAATVGAGDVLQFGVNGTVVQLASDFDGQLANATIFLNGADTGATVTGIAADILTASTAITAADGDVLSFSFVGASVDTELFGVDDASVATVGAAVTLNGVDTGAKVAEILAGNVIRFDGAIAAAENDFFGFAFATDPITATRFRVDDTSGISPTVLVTGVAGLPADLRVLSVDTDPGQTSGTVTLDQAVSLSSGDVLSFGFNSAQIILESSSDADLVGALVAADGLDTGLTVVDQTRDTITLSGVLDLPDGASLGFTLNAADTVLDSDSLLVLNDTEVPVGTELTVNGVSTGVTVTEVLFGNLLRLSAEIFINNGDVLGFDFGSDPVSTTRLRMADTTGIDPGVLVNGPSGLPAMLRVTSVDAASGMVTLNQAVTVSADDVFGFGVIGDTVVVEALAEVEIGFTVRGDGVPSGTMITGFDTATRELTLSDTIDVADASTLIFGERTRTFQLTNGNILPGSLSGVMYDGNTASHTFSVDRSGGLTFVPIADPISEPIIGESSFDPDTGLFTLVFDVAPRDGVRLEANYEFGNLSLAALGFQEDGTNGRYSLGKDAYRGLDTYSQNPRNPGMRLILPGDRGELQEYFLRVRSQPSYDAATTAAEYEAALTSDTFAQPNDPAAGATSGRYELRVRLRQQDEKPGSTVRYADIRYPTVGIDVVGLPRNTQLAGENGENATDVNDTFGQAQQLGNLLETDRNTVSVAGSMSGEGDIDWFTFTLDFEDIQSISGVNSGTKTWATMFDIDYADGFRGDLTLSVFDSQGRLIYVGRDSDIADDQPGEGQQNDFDDLSRGSLGKLDPFIGSVHLPAGTPQTTTRYYVAISTNERLPSALDATFTGSATNPLIRLEPISSLDRIVEDRIGATGYQANGLVGNQNIAPTTGSIIDISSAITLEANVRPFTLADVTLFVSTGSSLYTVDAYTGVRETTVGLNLYTNGSVGDIDMRTDGRLFQYFGANNDGGNNGLLREINTATGTVISTVGDGISNDPDDPTFWQVSGQSVDALAIRRRDIADYTDGVVYSIRDGGDSFLYTTFGAGTVDFDNTAPNTFRVQMTGGTTGRTGHLTGLQFLNDTSTLFGLTSTGEFFQPFAFDFLPPVLADFSSVLQGGETFQGLASGPVNLEGGRYAGLFFAVTSRGRLVCIDPDAANQFDPAPSLVANVFDTNGDGYGDSHISNPTVGGATGLAFSPLDINLWHPTARRGDLPNDPVGAADPGHGQNSAVLLDRTRYGFEEFPTAYGGALSMYFGLENWDDRTGGFVGYGGTGQYGTSDVGTYNWQQDLTANPDIGTNYNLPGGAYGSLITNPFSLAGYAYTDKPTLYFNYFLETENAQSKSDRMRDSARVLISIDDGLTWQLLATNNQARSINGAQDAELPHTLSTSSAIATAGIDNQHVQELFDSTDSWRQARVDLGKWAGESNIRLRFDFSTAGELDATDRSTSIPDASLTVTDAVDDSQTVPFASVEGLSVGMLVQSQDDVDGLATPGIPAGTVIVAIDPDLNEVTLSNTVTLRRFSLLDFYGAFSTTRETLANADDAAVLTLDSVADITVGMLATAPDLPLGTRVTGVFPASNQVQLDVSVTMAGASEILFTRPEAQLRNAIADPAGRTGNFKFGADSRDRGANNAFEGFYIDDIIVGFAERGEMVTGANANETGFFDLNTPTGGNYFEQVLEGAYQLEIRRGTEFAIQPSPRSGNAVIVQTFDTNDRLVREAAETVLTLEENRLTAVDGLVVTSRGSGTATTITELVQDPDNPAGLLPGDPIGLLLAGTGSTTSPTEANAVMWHVDLDGQPAAYLSVDYSTGARGIFPEPSDEVLRPLPATFRLDANHMLPDGDGIAVSTDGGTTWTTVSGFTATSGATKRLELNLVAALRGIPLTADTVIGFFQSSRDGAFLRTEPVAPGLFTQVNYGAGILIANAEITTAPRIETSGLVGDKNHLREQGQFIIESNIVSHAAQYGIRVDAGGRDAGSNAPHPGVARNLPTINHDRLVPGAVIVNNIVSSSGQAGILFSGDANAGNVPTAVVPYGRVINNTIYGGDTATGIGVHVTENAAPTLLNNLFANLETGIEVDGTSQAGTVVGYSAYSNVSSAVNGVTETAGLVLDDDPFVNASTGNFYLTDRTPAIDSAIDVLQDRNGFVVVKDAVGLPPSPILAPAKDLYGQLRIDDPSVAGSAPGLGLNVFKDRGAVDRVDFSQPTIALAVPLDNSPIDQEKTQPNTVRLERSTARGRSRFVLQLNDIGVGIDKNTVDSAAFRITYSPYPGAPASERTVLAEGVDYLYRYLEASNQVVLESAAVYPLGSYRIDVTTRAASFFLPALLNDLAGSTLLPNSNDGSISFTISLADEPSAPDVVGSADEGLVDLAWTAAANGLEITGYEVEQSHNDGAWTSVPLADPTQTAVTVTGLIDGDSYSYRVRAINSLGTSDWGLAGPFTPLQVPVPLLVNDTGAYTDDGITTDGLVDVSNLLTGADWEYSTNSGITWRAGSGDSFTLLPRTYAAGSVQVRQTFNGATSSPGTNAIVWDVDVTSPFAPSITSAEDNAGLITGIVRDGSITDDPTPTLYGTAEGNSQVTVYDGSDPLGTAWADAAGLWSFTPSSDLANRSHAFAALARDLAGNAGPQSPLYTVTIDTQAPEVSIDAVNDNLDPFTGRVENGGQTNDQTLTLVGRSTPSTTVFIKNGSTEVARAVTNNQGEWTVTTVPLAAGTYDLVANVTDSLGRTGMSAVYSVTIDLTPPATPVITTITDNVGSIQGAIADGGTTDDTTPTISGTAEPNAYISIFMTLPDGSLKIEGGIDLKANASGNWSFTPAPLANGLYEFKVVATDDAGNSSAHSAPRKLTVTSAVVTPPTTPGVLAITGVIDNAGSVQGDVAHNGLTDDTTLEITGTAPVAAVVEIRDGSTLLGSVVASAAGTWSYTTKPLADGLHSLTATVDGEATPTRNVTVQVNTDTSTGLDIAATGVWGPDPAEGYRTVLIDFNQPVTGVTVDAFMIEHRGRKILVQGATVTGGGMNYVLKLPDRFKNLTGGFTITLFSTDIESLLNPGSTMRKPSYFTLPDPGVNNNPG